MTCSDMLGSVISFVASVDQKVASEHKYKIIFATQMYKSVMRK